MLTLIVFSPAVCILAISNWLLWEPRSQVLGPQRSVLYSCNIDSCMAPMCQATLWPPMCSWQRCCSSPSCWGRPSSTQGGGTCQMKRLYTPGQADLVDRVKIWGLLLQFMLTLIMIILKWTSMCQVYVMSHYFRDYNSWVANMNNMKGGEAGKKNYEIK